MSEIDFLAQVESDAQDIVEDAIRDRAGLVNDLINKQIEKEDHIALLERKLELAKEEWADIAQRRLPALFDELQLSEWKMQDGRRMVLERKLHGSLIADQRTAGVDWVERQGFEGLITSEVVLEFDRNAAGRQEAKDKVEELRELNYDAVLRSNIHHSTLSAWIREYEGFREAEQQERLAQGIPETAPWKHPALPREYFNLTRINQTKVKLARKTSR